MQQLAAQLEQRMPWLARGRHIGGLVQLLQRHGLSTDDGWNADRLLRQLERQLRSSGQVVPDPARQRNPLGYLRTLLVAAAPAPPSPAVRQRREPAAWRVEGEARRRVLAAEDPALRAAAIAALRADMAAEGCVRPRSVWDRRP